MMNNKNYYYNCYFLLLLLNYYNYNSYYRFVNVPEKDWPWYRRSLFMLYDGLAYVSVSQHFMGLKKKGPFCFVIDY